MSILVCIVAGSFAVMGVVALVSPAHVLALFGTERLSVDAANEVRAVYGGYGLAVGGLLVAGLWSQRWGPGVFLTVCVALYGMAAGRLLSWLIDRHASRLTLCIAGVEVALATALLAVFLRQV